MALQTALQSLQDASGGTKMHNGNRRGPINKRRSHGAFKHRAGQTHKLNLAKPLRGGIRL